MRVTQETRRRTRQRILEAARELFGREGYGATTTRRIASEARIAVGTLFNYFPGKEALGLAILAEAAQEAEAELDREPREPASLEEGLFQHVAVGLRHLEPYRTWLGEVLDAGWSPLRQPRAPDEADEFRLRHLERVGELLRDADASTETSAANLHLYWTLYLGVLGFWWRDDSDHQEATLALLDRSLGLFCRALREDAGGA